MGYKNSLAVLAVRLGPLGHGLGFGGFLYPGKSVWLPLNEKTVGPFPPSVEFFFKKLIILYNKVRRNRFYINAIGMG